jgi:hypothetical protein
MFVSEFAPVAADDPAATGRWAAAADSVAGRTPTDCSMLAGRQAPGQKPAPTKPRCRSRESASENDVSARSASRKASRDLNASAQTSTFAVDRRRGDFADDDAPRRALAGYNAGTIAAGKTAMNWIGIVVALVCLYLAFRVAAFMVKLVLLVAVLCGLYAFFAPMLGMPSPFS